MCTGVSISLTALCSVRGNGLRQRKEAPDIISRSKNSQSSELTGNSSHSHQPY